jgi:predicted dehydrogenase
MFESRFGKLGAAIIGAGFIGAVHADALRCLGVRVTGVVGSSIERARAAGVAEPYASLEAMLADPAVDVVHVASPNHLHGRHVRAALNAGKHVVCEKPLSVSSIETGELLDLATASGLVHATNFNLRFYPQVLEAHARIASGELGEVRLVSGGYLQDWLLFDTDWNWRLDPALGGPLRAVADIGSHWIDLVAFATGHTVQEVCADLATFMPVRQQPTGPVQTFGSADSEPNRSVPRTIGTEDAATILLRLDGGARAVCAISQVAAGRKNRLTVEIDGAHETVEWDSERPEELWIGHRDRPNELLLRNPALAAPQVTSAMRLPAGHAEGFADTFVELYRRVYTAIVTGDRGGEPDYPTFAAGHAQALIGEALARSATQRGWETIAPTAAH